MMYIRFIFHGEHVGDHPLMRQGLKGQRRDELLGCLAHQHMDLIALFREA